MEDVKGEVEQIFQQLRSQRCQVRPSGDRKCRAHHFFSKATGNRTPSPPWDGAGAPARPPAGASLRLLSPDPIPLNTIEFPWNQVPRGGGLVSKAPIRPPPVPPLPQQQLRERLLPLIRALPREHHREILAEVMETFADLALTGAPPMNPRADQVGSWEVGSWEPATFLAGPLEPQSPPMTPRAHRERGGSPSQQPSWLDPRTRTPAWWAVAVRRTDVVAEGVGMLATVVVVVGP